MLVGAALERAGEATAVVALAAAAVKKAALAMTAVVIVMAAVVLGAVLEVVVFPMEGAGMEKVKRGETAAIAIAIPRTNSMHDSRSGYTEPPHAAGGTTNDSLDIARCFFF